MKREYSQSQQQRIFLLRHGEPALTRPQQLLGQQDLPLTDRGIAQAGAWQAFFRPVTISHVCCSDLIRAQAFAVRVIGEKKLAVMKIPALPEISLGDWDGLTPEEIAQRWPGQWEQRGNALTDFRPEGGESFSDLAARAIPAFGKIAHDSRKNPLIVTHAGVIRVLVAHVLGMPLQNIFRVRVDYGSLSVIISSGTQLILETLNALPESTRIQNPLCTKALYD